jgi:hypothetical protein
MGLLLRPGREEEGFSHARFAPCHRMSGNLLFQSSNLFCKGFSKKEFRLPRAVGLRLSGPSS